MKKYDVGIYGLWYGRTYGSMLTYYALSSVVNELGYSTVFISNPLSNEPQLHSLVRSHPLKFAAKHYEVSEVLPLSEMKKHNARCDVFLLGSDQMWRYELSSAYKYSYFFDFADSDKKKIAYGTSFGSKNYTAPDDYKQEAGRCLREFDAITVRDGISREILKREFGIEADCVADPVFLCDKKKYDELTDSVKLSLPKDGYLLAYILDPNPEIGEVLSRIADEEDISVLVAFDELGNKDDYKDALALTSGRVTGMGDLTPEEWLYLFKNANSVITNSFHGSCFSIIYGRPFTALVNSERGADRFSFLLDGFGLTERLAHTPRELYEKHRALSDSDTDFLSAIENGREEIERSKRWLSSMLYGATPCKKTDCVGCGACVSRCPKECISLKADEHGYYRAVIDHDRCIKCGACKKVCPALSNVKRNPAPRLYEAISRSSDDVMGSSSGGVFPILSREILKDGGAVVGAAFTNTLTVEHVIAESEDELLKIRKSKYMQSYVGDTLKRVKAMLDSGRRVLYSGCPCQIAGIKSYLGRDYDNLLLVDILCAGTPSSLFFKKYIEDEHGEGTQSYVFRYKDEDTSWNCFTTCATLADGRKIIRTKREEDPYQRAFHSHTMTPPHCQNCRYQGRERHGDITLGDFWGIEKNDPKVKSRYGVSALMVNTDKGERLLKSVGKRKFSLLREVPIEWIGVNGMMKDNKNFISPYRDRFFTEILKRPFGEALEYAVNGYVQDVNSFEGLNPLQLRFGSRHFTFEEGIWEESLVDTMPRLSVIPEAPGFGHYASMPLQRRLEMGKKYGLYVKFKFKTTCPVINFHAKRSGSRDHQVIYSYRHSKTDRESDFVEIRGEFVSSSGLYDEFMIGAAHFIGRDNFILFDSIYIFEMN